jgi:hypothetical protein
MSGPDFEKRRQLWFTPMLRGGNADWFSVNKIEKS